MDNLRDVRAAEAHPGHPECPMQKFFMSAVVGAIPLSYPPQSHQKDGAVKSFRTLLTAR